MDVKWELVGTMNGAGQLGTYLLIKVFPEAGIDPEDVLSIYGIDSTHLVLESIVDGFYANCCIIRVTVTPPVFGISPVNNAEVYRVGRIQ